MRTYQDTESTWSPREGGAAEGRGCVGTSYLWAISALAGLRLQVLTDVSARAEASVRGLLVDLPDVAVRLGGHIPGSMGRGGERDGTASVGIWRLPPQSRARQRPPTH